MSIAYFSQLLLNHLLWFEIGSLSKHGKDHSNQLMGRGKESLLRGQSFFLSLKEIGLEESVLRNHRSGHQIDRSSQMPIASFGYFTNPNKVS